MISRAFRSLLVPGLAVLISISPIAVLAQTPSSSVSPLANAEESAPAIAIGAGDLLRVVVFDTPELSSSVRVNQSGEVNIPVLGVVRLAGLDANQAARTIEKELEQRGYLRYPHVTVFISEYASQGATVTGEVKMPGIYPTLGTRRLLDMLTLAGGLSPTAGKVVSITHRSDAQHPILIALQSNVEHMNLQPNPVIQPGDTVIVSKAGVVYVIGDVLKPGGFLVDNNARLSLIQALSLAGGWNKTAAMSQVKLIRKTAAGREQVDLDLKHVMYGKQADIKVSDGDIIFVPSSNGKTFGYRGIEAAIAIATGVLIYSNTIF
ncbi:polysaccharide export outer membrane protein [Acidipila rosea]|uniref:Polysaccharide export outer membrane protein n=1 Tax=Acidipila rosea TaxID=768535 RepID=A0A4R1LAN9_9BACT|nr:polysaccharide export outer membrane protein [Acidipila rosea]